MNKKNRSGRATCEQYSRMIDFFVNNKGLAEGKFTALHGRLEASRKWEELATILNSLHGAEKSAAQWQVAWRDLKSRTSIKARERRKEIAATGNNPISKAPLSDLDQKVLSLLGTEYVVGSSQCVDNIPEEDSLQIALESGDVSVLSGNPAAETPLESIAEILTPTKAHDTPAQTSEASASKRRTVVKRKTVHEDARDGFSKIAKQQACINMMSFMASVTR